MNNPLMEMVDQNGRLNYINLSRFVNQTSLEFFTGYTNRPFLVGVELFEGLFTKAQVKHQASKTVIISKSDINDTVCFQRELVSHGHHDSNANDSSISRAIFTLVKKPYSKGMRNVINIGRDAESDMVIADYSVSREHAEVTIYFDKFYITDLGSTNGTSVNDAYLEPRKRTELRLGSRVAFGRLAFKVMSAADLHKMLRDSSRAPATTAR